MPNYLQRVAAAGARTGSSVKPPAAAPLLVPDGVIPAAVPWSEPGVEEANVAPEERPLMASPLPPRQMSGAAKAPIAGPDIAPTKPITSEEAQTPSPRLFPAAPSVTRSFVQAPRGLRREPPSPASAAQPEPKPLLGKDPLPAPAPTSEGVRPVESPMFKAPGTVPAAAEPIHAETIPVALKQQAEPQWPGSSEAPTPEKAAAPPGSPIPPQIRSEEKRQVKQENVPVAHAADMPISRPQAAVPSAEKPQPSAPRAEVQLQKEVAQASPAPERSPSAPRTENLSSPEPQVEPGVIRSSAPATSPVLNPRIVAQRERVVTAMAPAATVVALPTVPSSGQNRINIGRIEVQVNNQTPQIRRADVAPAANPAPVDFLEARYLNRFAMKP